MRVGSREVLNTLEERKVDYVSKVLPCGHYTTGETPYKYMDGWYLGSFVYGAFKKLATKGRATATPLLQDRMIR